MRNTECGVRNEERERMNESAKQSQLGWRVSSARCEVSCSTPALGGDPSRGRLGHVVVDPACETKPIASQAPSGADCTKQSQFRVSREDHRQAALDAATREDETDCTKQSQSGGRQGRAGLVTWEPGVQTKPICRETGGGELDSKTCETNPIGPGSESGNSLGRVAASRPKALAMVLRTGKPPSPSCARRCHPLHIAGVLLRHAAN